MVETKIKTPGEFKDEGTGGICVRGVSAILKERMDKGWHTKNGGR